MMYDLTMMNIDKGVKATGRNSIKDIGDSLHPS